MARILIVANNTRNANAKAKTQAKYTVFHMNSVRMTMMKIISKIKSRNNRILGYRLNMYLRRIWFDSCKYSRYPFSEYYSKLIRLILRNLDIQRNSVRIISYQVVHFWRHLCVHQRRFTPRP
jgi:hypothetical protein